MGATGGPLSGKGQGKNAPVAPLWAALSSRPLFNMHAADVGDLSARYDLIVHYDLSEH